jgi:hypothetical protein
MVPGIPDHGYRSAMNLEYAAQKSPSMAANNHAIDQKTNALGASMNAAETLLPKALTTPPDAALYS